MKPRPYQQKLIDAVHETLKDCRSALAVLFTGGGKTICFSHIADYFSQAGRVLVLAHREELINQAAEKIAIVTGHMPDIEMGEQWADQPNMHGYRAKFVVSSIQTQVAGRGGKGRMTRFSPDDFSLLIIDECFPAGTLIDGKPIEQVAVGDRVRSFNHATGRIEERAVSRIFRSRPKAMVTVHLSDGRSITCTAGHPFYSQSQHRYVQAVFLAHGEEVLTDALPENLHPVRRGIRGDVQPTHLLADVREDSAAVASPADRHHVLPHLRQAGGMQREARAGGGSARTGVLLPGMRSGIRASGVIGHDDQDQSAICLGTYDPAQPDATRGVAIEDGANPQEHGLGSAGSRWEWHGLDGTRGSVCQRDRMEPGHRPDEDPARAGIPDTLQDRRGQSRPKDCGGDRRAFPRCRRAAQAGSKERNVPGVARVEGVSIHQPSNRGGFGRLCPDGLVYNIEVDGNHNYFADGVLVHNCHHATASSYKRVIQYYQQNPNLKVLGVTATPDRADEEALGQVFDRVAYVYEINDGIGDGWLVPITQRSVVVEGLDFSHIHTTAGDLNGAELAAVMEYEENLHRIAHPTYELAAGRKTLVFAASVAHAERLCEIFNRHKDNCARFICGKTDDVVRKQTLADFRAGAFQFLVNVAVLTEGYDEPTVEVIAVARPTKSRALYAQIVGRGTRPLPGLIDHLDTPAERIASITASAKPALEVLDFVGNAGRHKLVTCADILGGNYSEATIALASEKARESDEPVDMRRMLELAEEELEKRRLEAERRRQAEAANRAKLVARAEYAVSNIDAFDVLDIAPARERGWDKSKPASEKQIELLRKFGIPNAAELSGTHARQLIGNLLERSRSKKCTYKQVKKLGEFGIAAADMSFAEGKQMLDKIAANGWRIPAELEVSGVI